MKSGQCCEGCDGGYRQPEQQVPQAATTKKKKEEERRKDLCCGGDPDPCRRQGIAALFEGGNTEHHEDKYDEIEIAPVNGKGDGNRQQCDDDHPDLFESTQGGAERSCRPPDNETDAQRQEDEE